MNIEELGRRAVACKHWRWLGGMAIIGRPMWRVVERVGLPPYTVHGYDEESLDGMLPDLADPATLGCLLHLVREAWGDATADVIHFDVWKTNGTWGHEWTVQCRDAGRFTKSRGATEVEALVAALEAAP